MWTEEFNSIFEQLSQSDAATSPDSLYAELIQEISSYHPSRDTTMIDKAYKIASDAHSGQVRKSGEPFIIHPLCVAIILSKLKMDKETIEAALLHDVVEDTAMSNEDLSDIFGGDVAHLVEGVTKLSQLPIHFDIEEIQAVNLRKMFLAMAKDIRVIIIKLADRLHNLRTLQFQPPKKQIKIAKETIEIYAPLAMKLGISKIKVELDDLSLQYLHPDIYRRLTEELKQLKPVQDKFKNHIINEIEASLKSNKITAKIYPRTKHLFSIYKKMMNQSANMSDIYDTFAICIVVGSIKDCYSTLGILHDKFSPVYGRFKDYIAMPKQNMYQSLHTTLISEEGRLFEVQIKTYEMLMASEYGITMYWKYNKFENGKIIKSSSAEKMVWLQQILDWQRDLADNKDFLVTLKEDFNLLSERINCFTPKGDVKILPKGSTVIDFAYSVHTTIGNTMISAMVNQAVVPITTILEHGDIVEIITSQKGNGPQTHWLKHAKTPQAKNKINEWLKNHLKQENIDKGIQNFKEYCMKNGLDYQFIVDSPFFETAVNFFGFKNRNTFWVSLSTGTMGIPQFIRRFSKISSIDLRSKKGKPTSITVQDEKIIHDFSVHYSKCCNPMPGDHITGVITKSHGISVHRTGCPNLKNIIKTTPDQIVKIDWLDNALDKITFSASLDIHVINRIGMLEDITKVFAENSLDIRAIDVKNEHKELITINILFYVDNKQTLKEVMSQISTIENVTSVERV